MYVGCPSYLVRWFGTTNYNKRSRQPIGNIHNMKTLLILSHMFAVVRYAPTLNPWLRHFDYSFVKLWCTKQPRIGIPKIGRKR